MVVVQSYLTKNDCYKAGRTITVKGIILNSAGCPQPSPKVFLNNWDRPKKNLCMHALIDANDGKAYQFLPWNYRGWHSGGSADDTHIGVMMCESPIIRYTSPETFTLSGDKTRAVEAVNRTYKTAVELIAQLCLKYRLDPMAAVISRKEAIEKGIAKKSGTPETLWNGLGTNLTMDMFRKDVAAEIAKIQAANAVEPSEKIEKDQTAPISKTIMIRIDVDNLRIRVGPGTSYATTGKYTGKGVFEISEIQNGSGATKGWGKLANGSGWVMLDYVTMLSIT